MRVPDSGVKTFDVPDAGRLTFDYTVLEVAGEAAAGLQLVTYVPAPGTGTEERMAALLRPASAARAGRVRPGRRTGPALR